jgi:quercetin dioxygenase-like cupin family protein
MAKPAVKPAPAKRNVAPDPLKVDAKHYTVEFENEKVRVLRIKYAPHEKSPMHSHPALVGIFLTPHHSRHMLSDGTVIEMTGNTGDVRYLDAIEHAPENLSDSPFELIAVELKS